MNTPIDYSSRYSFGHFCCHDGVTLYFSVKFPSIAPEKTRNGHFSIYVNSFPLSEVKTTKKMKEENFD